uniref:G-2 and S-phase expressed 1 n=1 Tax=Cyprinus carpio TaxID=7962 RepID=A0A8C2EEG0_CYPCA
MASLSHSGNYFILSNHNMSKLTLQKLQQWYHCTVILADCNTMVNRGKNTTHVQITNNSICNCVKVYCNNTQIMISLYLLVNYFYLFFLLLDFVSLAEEKFDFDVSLSPESSKGDYDAEDEVFIGPISHKEKCISHGVEIHVKDSISSGPSLGEEPSWSPLTGEKFDEICKEAQLLASHLEQTVTDSVAESSVVSSSQAIETETFEEDTTSKLNMFSKPADVLSPIKRETFLVQDSPMKQLPPAIQKRMLKSNGTAGFGKPRLSTSSPVRPAVTQPKLATRGKAIVTSSGVLPSKPTAQGNSRLSSSTKMPPATKSRLPPPSKGNFGLKRSPSSRNTSRAGSSEDHLSDNTSVASDVSDSSFNSSLPGRSSIPARNKTELRAPAALKAPSLQNSRVVDRRRNTSSSSSSVSSINSSLTISPGSKAKHTSSLNSSTNSIGARSHSSMSRLPSSSRKSSVVTRNPEPPVSRRASISTQGRRASELLPRPVKATPIKKTDPLPPSQLQTPAKNTGERTASTSSISASAAKMGSALRGNPKLKVPVVPTPTNYLKGVRKSEVSSSPDIPRIMKPKRLLTACSVDSIPDHLVGPPVGLLTPSAMGSKLRRPSALPTPVNRRISGIPALTPKSVTRLSKPSQVTEHSSTTSQTATHSSPENMKESENQEDKQISVSNEKTCPPADLQPCSLVFNMEDEPEEPPPCEPAVVENPSEPPSCDPEPLEVEINPPTLPSTVDTQKHLQNTEKKEVKEVLLVDAPAPALQLTEKMLIDLSNTPDLIKTSSGKPWGGQLIDLSSPLIKWSPEDKNKNAENAAPLIDLSF